MIELVLFLTGVHLCIQFIAKLYGIIDLWYRIREFAAGIFLSIAVYSVVVGGLIWLLQDSYETAFIAGIQFFLIFHVAIYWLGKLWLWVVDL